VYRSHYDPVFDLSALEKTRDFIFQHLTKICKQFNIEDPTSSRARVILAFYVQAVLEKVILSVLGQVQWRDLIVSGGVFYNVKLNKLLVDQTQGLFCAYPLAGDQGNALGLYAIDHPNFEFPKTLNWGTRSLRDVGYVSNMHVVDERRASGLVLDFLRKEKMVNLVRGPMEFGPRALCNTSTLAMPHLDVVSEINFTNNRNTVMPMAPVVTLDQYLDLFKHTDRVWKSCNHMVVAMEYKETPHKLLGVSHEYSYPYAHFTGRPQVIADDDYFMKGIIREIGTPLINTSFNFHGRPIAYDMVSIIENHILQVSRNPNLHTVVISNE
jgi:predicted NodU family carbamoyl transferase